MKIVIVVGARPNFMKAAPLLRAISAYNEVHGDDVQIERIFVHTGQHYDAALSDAFFVDLNLPTPDIFLGAGSGSHAVQTAEIMRRFEEVLLQHRPDVVVVVGDVNSTIACALVTAKIALEPRPLIAHVEAGLRSFDRAMPEECNRVLTDHLADFLFVTEESGVVNLSREGIPPERVFFVGNTMIDTLLAVGNRADTSVVLDELGLRRASHNGGGADVKPYALLTLHRPANVDDPVKFMQILRGLRELVSSHDVIFPVHPRTRKMIEQHCLGPYFDLSSGPVEDASEGQVRKIKVIGPKGYLDFVCLMKHASVIVTDSGGVQEESTCLGVPCVTVRENTERPITLTAGTNVLAGVEAEGICGAIRHQLTHKYAKRTPEKWDGMAGTRIIAILAASRNQTNAMMTTSDTASIKEASSAVGSLSGAQS
jgi:UDP-N-acetylglucosamine 2-epimerase (non-hydrolysing)